MANTRRLLRTRKRTRSNLVFYTAYIVDTYTKSLFILPTFLAPERIAAWAHMCGNLRKEEVQTFFFLAFPAHVAYLKAFYVA